jgi:hypothetical protein
LGLGVAVAQAQSLSPTDRSALDRALNQALEVAETGVATSWRSPDSGRGGTIVIERTFFRDVNAPCRSYEWTLQEGARTLRGEGTGCRIARENWRLQEETPRLATGGGGRPARPAPPPPTETPKPARTAAAPSTPSATPPAPSAPAAEPPAPMPKYTLPSRTAL